MLHPAAVQLRCASSVTLQMLSDFNAWRRALFRCRLSSLYLEYYDTCKCVGPEPGLLSTYPVPSETCWCFIGGPADTWRVARAPGMYPARRHTAPLSTPECNPRQVFCSVKHERIRQMGTWSESEVGRQSHHATTLSACSPSRVPLGPPGG